MKMVSLVIGLLFLNLAMAANTQLVMETSHGTIEIELFEDKAPNTAANFLKYVDAKFYDGTIFHRVINNFMIQGGGFTEQMAEKPTQAPIKNEATNGLRNEVGTLAMARTGDPHSATAQFFINVNDNAFLNHTSQTTSGWGYAVFGKVTSGMHVVNRIKAVKTGTVGMYQDVPMDAVVIKSVRRKEAAKEASKDAVKAPTKPAAKKKK